MSSLRNKVDCSTQLEKKQQTLLVQQELPLIVNDNTQLIASLG